MHRRALLAALPTASALAALARPAGAQSLLERIPFLNLGPGADGFVNAVSVNSNYSIAASRLLLERSAHPQIRQLAEREIADHTRIAAELGSMPEATTRLPPALDERHTAMLLKLRQQDSVDLLNRWYVEQQIQTHENALEVYRAFAAEGEVPSLRNFAARHIDTIRTHLEAARALQLPRDSG